MKICDNFGRYLVSERGEVFCTKHGKVLTQQVNKDGYACITLWNDEGRRKTVRIHRLVAQAFVSNPNKYPEVNHLDGNKLNNVSSNLEWCTHAQNIKHAWDIGLIKNTEDRVSKIRNQKRKFGGDNCNSSKVVCMTTGEVFLCIKDACEKYGVSSPQLSKCCTGKAKSAGNISGVKLVWEYFKENGNA